MDMYYQNGQYYLSSFEITSNLACCAACTAAIVPQNGGKFACNCGFNVDADSIENLSDSWKEVFAQEQQEVGAIRSLAAAIDKLSDLGEVQYAEQLALISANLTPEGKTCEVPRVASILKEVEERAILHANPKVQKLSARIGLLRHQLENLQS